MGVQERAPTAPVEPEPLSFSVEVDAKHAALTLEACERFGWVRLDALELEVRLRGGEKPGSSPAAYQSRRTRARQATLRMTQADLDTLALACAGRLASVGVDELSLRAMDGYVSLVARVRAGGQVAELTARVYLDAAGSRLRLLIDEARTYGFLPTPAPLIAHTAITAMLGTNRWSAIRGLAELELIPLEALLWHTLPPAGWRLPSTSDLVIADVRCQRDEVLLHFGASEGRPTRGHVAELSDAHERFRAAEELLRSGEIAGALRAYRAELAARGAEEPFLIERILAVASSQPELFIDAVELARQALGRWPDYAPAHNALANIATAQNDGLEAAHRFQILAGSHAAVGDDDAASKAALAGARLLRRLSPAESTPLYELVLEHNPNEPEATEALTERYRDENRWRDLIGLIRGRISAATDPRSAARDHLRLAEILDDALGDVRGARSELHAATRLDPASGAARESLAEVESKLGDSDAALAALDEAVSIYTDRGELRSVARALKRAARIAEDAGDDTAAEARYRAALDRVPNDAAALRGAAGAASRRGRWAEAAELWRLLLLSTTDGIEAQTECSYELGACLLEDGDTEGARPALQRATRSPNPAIAAEARALLAEIHRSDGDLESAAVELETAIDGLLDGEAQRHAQGTTSPPIRFQSRAAELCLTRARLLESMDQVDGATTDYRRAFELAVERMGARREAARALLERAAAAGDPYAERQWIDALLESEPSERERRELLLGRARIALAAGRSGDAARDVTEALAGSDSDELTREALLLRAEIARADDEPVARAEALEARAAMSEKIADAIAASLEAAEAWLDGERAAEALAAAQRAITDIDSASDLGDRREAWRLRAHRSRAEAAWRRRQFAAVRESCEIVLAAALLDPATRAELTFRLAVALERSGDDEGAAERYESVIADDSASAELQTQTLRHLAEFHERLGHYAEAADRFCRLAERGGDTMPEAARADAWYRAAELYRKHQGRSADAESCLEAALKLVADHMPALDALETLKRETDDYERVAVILGRKIAATGRHPNRQKSLLVRLANLHETILGRIDVARETYNRALEIDADYRPALRFIAADARRHGRVDEAARTLLKLSGTLPEDADLADDPAALREERVLAALELADLAETQRNDETLDTLAGKALRRNHDREADPRLAAALEALYRRTHRWRELADQLGEPGEGDPVARDLERAEILWRQLDDPTAALLAIRGARDRHPDDPQLAEYETVLEEVAASSDTETGAGFGREVAGAIAAALEARSRGEHESALAHLEAIAGPAAPDDLLMLRSQLREALGQWDRAVSDLTLLRRRAASSGDVAFEHRLCRKLAALTAEKLGDGLAALALYERALEIDPDDLAAAEACVSIYERRGDRAAKIPALERILEIAERTGAGPQTQVSARRELAGFAARAGNLDRALEHLEEALASAPEDEASLRMLAQVYSDRGDLEKQGETLRLLAGSLANRSGGLSPNAGELYLELADIYYDKLHDAGRGRAAMLAAARAFGAGSRSRSILRLLASEAASENDPDIVVQALEAVPLQARSSGDLIQLARAYQRLGRDHKAVEVLESARGASRLDDEGAMLLLGLYRQIGRKRELAGSLEKGASDAPPAIAATRLMEALSLFENSLDDPEAAERVRRQLAELAHVHQEGDLGLSLPHRPSPEELERAAEAAASGSETAVAADLLAQAVTQRARALARGGRGLDQATRRALDNLRQLARRDRHYEALARGLLAASAVEAERRAASVLLREAAQVRRRHLHDTRGAADALARALALLPDDDSLVEELDATLREAGDYSQLASAYELHLGAVTGRRRAQPLIELARLYRDVFREPDRAKAYLSEALEVAPELSHELDRELAELERAAAAAQQQTFEESGPQRRSPEKLLELAAELEEADQLDAAIAQCERAAAMTAGAVSKEPLVTLERLYKKRGDWGAVSEVLGRMAAATGDPAERAEIWYRRADLYRDVLHREAEAYRCLKEAHANAPEDGAIAHSLRSVAMARGEWALAAELLYREIAAADTDVDRGALYLELAMIFDEKLLDVDAATINYEQALAYDPEIPAAPRPLARLYELRGRHAEAAEMYEMAAARARTDEERGRLLRHAGMSAEHGGELGEARRLYGLAAVAGTTDDHQKAQVALARLGGDSKSVEGRIRMLELRLSETGDPETRLDLQRQLLELATAAGDSEAATRYAKLLLDSDRTDVSAFVALKSRAAESGDWQQVASLLSSRAAAVGDSGEQAALYYELGRAYEADLGDLNAAVGAYEQALTADPKHPGALEALAEITYKKHDWLRAYQIYQRLSPERCSMPADVIALRQGEIAEALGREVEACDAFAEAVRLFPASRQALTALARTARRVGDLKRAIAATRALLELAPTGDVRTTTRIRGELAGLLSEAGDITGAIYYYELVVSEEPKAAGALAQLLDLYSEKGDYQGAAGALRNLIALTGDADQRADLLYRLGELYRTQLDDPDLAADAYLKAVDLAPEHIPVLRRLLEYYFRVGDDKGMVEVGVDLAKVEGLAHSDSGKENLARLMLLSALRRCWDLVEAIGHWFGVEASERLILAMLECARADRASWSPEALSAAGAAVCARLEIDGAGIFERISELAAGGDSTAELLREALAH